jgi:hypothetical protein
MQLGCFSWWRKAGVVFGRCGKKNNPMSSFPTTLTGGIAPSGDSSSSNLHFFCFSLSLFPSPVMLMTDAIDLSHLQMYFSDLYL